MHSSLALLGNFQMADSKITSIMMWMRALRVDQWTKNGAVMLAWFFSVADSSQRDIARGWESFLMALAMAGSFSLVSSAFYLLNDVADFESDKRHPVKKFRPVAAGLLHRFTAVRVALVCFATGSFYPAMVVILSPGRALAYATILAYVVMQCLYTGFLKKIPYLDVITLAAGFVLRAVAGAAIITAYISPWLLVCTFTLSLFLALCKRNCEMENSPHTREVLKHYRQGSLKFFIILTGLCAWLEYLAYTLTSTMGNRFGLLPITAAFVLCGITRYAYLAVKGDVSAERPERLLLSDKWLWAAISGYAISAVSAVAAGS